MIILPSKLRWIIIASALFMMVISVSVSAKLVHKNDNTINTLRSEVGQKNELMRSLWQNTNRRETQLQMLALYTALSHNSNEKALNDFTQNFAKLASPKTTTPIDINALPALLAELKTAQDNTISRIDDIFIEKLEKEEEISRLTQKNLLYMSLAMFAQLLSVALITVVRDLK